MNHNLLIPGAGQYGTVRKGTAQAICRFERAGVPGGSFGADSSPSHRKAIQKVNRYVDCGAIVLSDAFAAARTSVAGAEGQMNV